MKYEYKVVVITYNSDAMTPNVLDSYFKEGWEYVDNITQSVSAGEHTQGIRIGPVAVVLKKEKE